MRKALFVFMLIAVLCIHFPVKAGSTLPGDLTLGINAGYPLGAELELEYKYGMFAVGIFSGMHAWPVNMPEEGLLEWEMLGACVRLYVPIGKGFDFYLGFSSSILGFDLFTATLMSPTWIMKIGPGFDFRWEHLRVGLEGGFLYSTYTDRKSFYIKAGVGLIFW